MKQYIVKGQQKLALGYTTGSCAAGAAKAAALALLTGKPPRVVRLMTPKGILLTLDIEEMHCDGQSASCAVRKDAGDDPDITHGMLVFAQVCRAAEGIAIDGGEGVGRVTKPGLAQPVGTAAINPAPRQQIAQALREVAAQCGYTGGFAVTISIPGGAETAQQTFNPALGIVGGLSVLGTSGIVEPMSEQALIDTIRLDIDAHWAAGKRVLFVTPGNYGADFAQTRFGLRLDWGVKCSNFIGEALDYAVYRGFSRILLIGHGGKLLKLAAGVFQTHSAYADGRQEILAAHAAACGANAACVGAVLDAVSVDACLDIIEGAGVLKQTLVSVSQRMEQHLSRRIATRGQIDCRVEYSIFTTPRGVLMQSPGAARLAQQIRQENET